MTSSSHPNHQHPPASTPGAVSDVTLKIPVKDLRLGMYVSELDRPWLESSFPFQGFRLTKAEEVEAVQQVCDYVRIDVAKSSAEAFPQPKVPKPADAAVAKAIETDRRAKPRSPVQRVFDRLSGRGRRKRIATDVADAITRSGRVFDETGQLVRSIMDDARLGHGVDTPAAKTLVADCVDQIIHNPDALYLLSSIKDKDAYTQEHSVNVAILSIILGHKLELPRDQLEELGLSGLLHDIGKVFTPDEILKKPDRLTFDEFLIMKMHPTQGRDVLQNSEGISDVAMDVAHSHHERLDGSGYPRGLGEHNTSLFAKIVAITDTFDAITSDRVYGQGRTNIEAFKILQSSSGNRYQNELVSGFIDAIGIYPPGSVAQLNNGDIGVVVRTNPRYRLRPVLLILKDQTLHPLAPRYVDLADHRDSGKGKLQIAHMLRAKDVGIDSRVFRNQRFLAELAD